jgi:hypothetical protein
LQFSSALIKEIGERNSLQLDYLWRHRARQTDVSADEYSRGRWRLEGRFNSGDIHVRSYIGYNTRSERRDYLSLFATMRLKLRPDGLVQLWSNLHRWSSEGIEYWYSFVRGEQGLFDNVRASIKLAHTYRPTSVSRGTTTFSLGAVAEL